ncbi:hypothetical protein [Deminuibacter soli]|uniref:Uncharacterized protein n=1 Tax=Deminuibacter soli TaxID=2291815 RepID=A0A3E1NNC1_9BACT|nr:hypothetical protein [Deminuibacter soli]RFM29413.1 hypothetical protein DXN05_00025 [Deminuibacter soli]
MSRYNNARSTQQHKTGFKVLLLVVYVLFFSVQLCFKFAFAAQARPFPMVVKNQYGQVLPIHTMVFPDSGTRKQSFLILDKRYQPEDMLGVAVPVRINWSAGYSVVKTFFPTIAVYWRSIYHSTANLRGPPVILA